MIRVLFVCTGNTCRSPIAEAMLRHAAEQEGLPIEVKSAGVATGGGIPTSTKSKLALQAKGITFEGQSQPVTDPLLDWADYILTMTESHKQTILLNFPQVVDKVYTLKQFAWMNEEYEQLYKQLDEYIAELQTQIQLGQPLDEELRDMAIELEAQLPDFDIADPFGGTQEHYNEVSEQIEQAILATIQKIKLIIAKQD